MSLDLWAQGCLAEELSAPRDGERMALRFIIMCERSWRRGSGMVVAEHGWK
jgi:hypothetical protein